MISFSDAELTVAMGLVPVGNGSLFHGTVHRNAPLSQALREHQRGLASRLRAQNGICAERIGIRRISTVPVAPAIHGHGCGRRVVHVVRIEFGDAVGPTVVAEQGIIVDERHGSDAPLPQRLGRVCRKRSQPARPLMCAESDSPTPSSMSPLPLSTNREVPSSRCSK